MRILDINGNEITNPDLDLGHLEQEEIVTQHHDAIPANPGSFHYEVIREYPNGGKDVEQVWDIEPTEAVAAWDETEIIQRYILYTQEELDEIAARKRAEEEAAAQEDAERTARETRLSNLEDALLRLDTEVVKKEVETAEDLEDIDYVRQKKLRDMSEACADTIEYGFDIQLSDGYVHHFSLTIVDQVMIMALAQKAKAGQTVLPWHADGEACQFFSPEDILTVNTEMENLITFEETYFNSLKQYILSMNVIEQINAVTYGQEIPEAYWSDVYRAIITPT